jgi:hypothetical protein
MQFCFHDTKPTLKLTYLLLTYSMKQSPSWESNGFSASQEIPRVLWSPKLHYRSHKGPPPVPTHQSISTGPRLTFWLFRKLIRFYGEELLAPRPTPMLEDHLLSAVCDCLFNIFAATPLLEAVPPSATWGRAILWWKRPICHGFEPSPWISISVNWYTLRRLQYFT